MGSGSTPAKDQSNGVSVEELSRRYHAVLLRYFARRGITIDEAPDLVQDVFARLSRNRALDNVASAEGYLFATAANIAMDYFRHRRVRADHPATGFVDRVQITADFSPERVLEGRQELACVVSALNEMPERMRNILSSPGSRICPAPRSRSGWASPRAWSSSRSRWRRRAFPSGGGA